MKPIAGISLGPRSDDYAFETEFLGQDFKNQRIGTNGRVSEAADLLRQWDDSAAAISGINGVFSDEDIAKVRDLAIAD